MLEIPHSVPKFCTLSSETNKCFPDIEMFLFDLPAVGLSSYYY